MPERVFTIGVYGFTAHGFFGALVDADVDLLCDVRARRGVRGREYAFANAVRLTSRLRELGIPYLHFPQLAPTPEIRAQQHAVDAATGMAKRLRAELAPEFIDAYEVLLDTDPAREAINSICDTAVRPALLCVERLPTACHRSLLAARIGSRSSADVEDLLR